MQKIFFAAAISLLTIAHTHAAPNTTPPTTANTPVHTNPGIAVPIKRPDLLAEAMGPQFLFRVRNIGTANAPASTTRVMCYTNAAGAPTERCVEGTHFTVNPSIVNPPGTTKAGSNVWLVPTGGLDAVTGFTTFSLNIKATPTFNLQGLRFQVCADAANVVNELNEANNCQWSVYTWPN